MLHQGYMFEVDCQVPQVVLKKIQEDKNELDESIFPY